MKLLGVVKNPVSINRYLVAAGELTDGAKPPLGGCRAAHLVAVRRTGRAACSGDRRSVTRTRAETTAAKAMRQRNERKRKRGFYRGGAEPASREGFALRSTPECGARTRSRATGAPRPSATTARGHAN